MDRSTMCDGSLFKSTIRPFSVTADITFCLSTDTYCGLYLRGAMSAVTGIYLLHLLLNRIILSRDPFFTLTNSAHLDEMPHYGISLVYKCKKNMYRKICFTIYHF